MSLQDEIDERRAEIRTDAYGLSIGEWISLYEKSEIDIHPEFQRFFRWSDSQKTRLIESILLGIPIPQIFVSQRRDGVWDVVDGLQRLSTIYQFVGILKDEYGNPVPRLQLEQTKYLPSLKGVVWEAIEPSDISLTQAQRLLIKRSKIDVSIILRESDEKSKYELFQRLNTGGAPLSDQEVRNAILLMINRKFYEWIRGLSEIDEFKECIALTDNATEQQYDKELVVRFVIFRKASEEQLGTIGDVNDYLTEKISEIALSKNFDYAIEELAFKRTFDYLRKNLSSDSFRRWDPDRKRFMGGFLISGYEGIAIGMGFHMDNPSYNPGDVKEAVRSIWTNSSFLNRSGSGIRASQRIPRTIPIGRTTFAHDN